MESYQTTSEEHDRYGHVLQIRGSPRLAPASEMLKKHVCTSVKEDDERLDKLS